MQESKFDASAFSFVLAPSIDEKLLLDFYNAMYGERARALARLWKWLSRPGFWDQTGPMVFLHGDRVVAHLGLVPFHAFLDGKRSVVTRSTDFAVLPELQRHGVGVLLLKKWMELRDVQIGWPNEKAIGTCRKLKWSESEDSYLHFYPLRPFDHPSLIGRIPPVPRGILNSTARPFLGVVYRPHAASVRGLEPVDPSPTSVARFVTSSFAPTGFLQPVHDEDYLRWRLIESPEAPRYKVFNVGDLAMAVKLCEKRGHKYLDLLSVSTGCTNSDVRLLLSTLAIWGMREGYSYVRFFTKDRVLTNYLRRSLLGVVKRTHFIFHSPDDGLTQRLQNSEWHLELIDGDFEEF